MSVFKRQAMKGGPVPAASVATAATPAVGVGVFKVGSIVERDPSDVPSLLPMPPCSTESGFPKLRHARPLGTTIKKAETAVDVEAFVNSKVEENRLGTDGYGFHSDNLNKVLSMSAEEVAAALAEARLHFSDSTLQFLQKRGEAELSTVFDSKVDRETGVHSLSATGCEVSPTGEAGPASRDRKPEVAAAGLEYSWMDPTFESDSSLQQHSRNVLSIVDRFDLEGRKFVTKQKFVDHFFSVIKNDQHMVKILAKVDDQKILEVLNIAAERVFSFAIADMLCCCDVALDSTNSDDVVDRELFHHEYEHHRAGYSLHEACEFIRSEVSAQKVIGMRIVMGALERRELIVSLEAYGSHCEALSRTDRNSDYLNFAASFDSCLLQFEQSLLDLSAPHLDPVIAMKQGLSLDLRIRRLVVYVLMDLVSSDFPVELAYLVHREVTSSSSVLRKKIMTQALLKSYAYSPFEEKAASALATTGFWSIYGCPSFMMPQARRSELSYGEQIVGCLLKKSSALDDIKGRSRSTDKAYSVIENFALNYRWFRLGSMFVDSDTSMSTTLFHYIRAASGSFTWLEKEVLSMRVGPKSGLNLSDVVETFDSRWAAFVDLAAESLDVLNAAARSALTSTCINRTDILKSELVVNFSETYEAVTDLMMGMFSIANVLDMIGVDDKKSTHVIFKVLSKLSDLCSRWWCLVFGIVRVTGFGLPCFAQNEVYFAEHSLLHRVFVILMKNLRSSHSLLPSSDICRNNEQVTLWVLKILHVSVCSDIGFGVLHEILSALLSEDPSGSRLSPCNGCRSWSCIISALIGVKCSCRELSGSHLTDSLLGAFIGVLEQATKSTAAQIKQWVTVAETDKFLCASFVPTYVANVQPPRRRDFSGLIVLGLSRSLIRFGWHLLRCVVESPNSREDTVSFIHDKENSSMSPLAKEVNHFIATLMGRKIYEPPVSGGPDALNSFLSSVIEVTHIHGDGLCATLISISESQLNREFAAEEGLRAEILSLQSYVRQFFISPAVLAFTRDVLNLLPDLNGLFSIEVFWKDTVKKSTPSGQLLSNFNVSLLNWWEQILCTLRLIKVHIDGTGAENPVNWQNFVSILSVFLAQIISHPILDDRGLTPNYLSVCTNTGSAGLFSWKVTLIRQLVIIEILGLIAYCLNQSAEAHDTVNSYLSLTMGCISELSGPFLPISLDVALIFTKYMLLHSSVETHFLLDKGAAGALMGAVLKVLLIQRTAPALRLNFSNVLSDEVICNALLSSNRKLSGNPFPPTDGILHWLQSSNVFSSTSRQDVQSPWMYEICSNLSGDELFEWVSVLCGLLSALDSNFPPYGEEGVHLSYMPDGASGDNLGSILFLLLEISLPSNSEKWLVCRGEDATAKEVLITNFLRILQYKIAHLFSMIKCAERCGQQLINKAHAKFRIPNPASKSNTSPDYATFSSTAELVTQLLDASFSQQIDTRIHSSVLAVLLIPDLNIPRQIQQTIWTKFGEERLLHVLAESPLYEVCGICLVPLFAFDADYHLISIMAFELGRLRNKSDLKLPFCVLGVLRIAQYLFSAGVQLSGSRLSLFEKLLSSKDLGCTYSNDFIWLVLHAASKLPDIETLLHSSRNAEVLGGTTSKLQTNNKKLLQLLRDIDVKSVSSFVSLSSAPVLFDLMSKYRPDILSSLH